MTAKGNPFLPPGYKFIRTLGQGRFGSVHEVSKETSDEHFAMKILSCLSESDFEKNEHEISKLSKNQHRNVVGFVEVIEGANLHFVVLELCDHSLHDEITENEKLGVKMDVVRVYRVMRDVLDGIAFLHSRGEIYGDLKGPNVLIGKDGIAKLGDFGGVAGTGTMKTSNSAECGTMQFWAPEFFKQTGKTGSQIGSAAGDMWAFGQLLLEMLTSRWWIVGENAVEIQQSVLGFDVGEICVSAGIVGDLQILPSLLLSQNPSERISSAELVRTNRLQSVLGPETPLSRFVTQELKTTRQQLQNEQRERTEERSEAQRALIREREELSNAQEEIRKLKEAAGEQRDRSSWVLSHVFHELHIRHSPNPLSDPYHIFFNRALLFFHTLITASPNEGADLTQFGHLLSIIRDHETDPSMSCETLGSALFYLGEYHSETLTIITSQLYLNFIFECQQHVNKDGAKIEISDTAQEILMKPFLAPLNQAKWDESQDGKSVRPVHYDEVAHQLVKPLLSTFISTMSSVDENQSPFVGVDKLLDTITELLIDEMEMSDAYSIIYISSRLISENKIDLFVIRDLTEVLMTCISHPTDSPSILSIPPELIQILQYHPSDRIDSASVISTRTSILRLLLLLLNSLDEDTLPLRSSLVSFFTSDRIHSLLPKHYSFRDVPGPEKLSATMLLLSFFSHLINVLLLLLHYNPSFADHIPFSSIERSLNVNISCGSDKDSLLTLAHHLLEVLLSCSSHSTFLAILDDFNDDSPFARNQIWESSTALFAGGEPNENAEAPSTRSPHVERTRRTVLRIEPHTNLVTRAFNRRIQNDTESPPLLSLLFTNSSQQEVIHRRQHILTTAFSTESLSPEQVVMEPFFSDVLTLFGHIETLFNDTEQRRSLLLSDYLFNRLFDLFNWLTTDYFSFDINLVALSKIQFFLSCLSFVNIDDSYVSSALIRFTTTTLNIFHQRRNIQPYHIMPPLQPDEMYRRPEMFLPG
ncbi:putative CBL-interacting serine/threonine-protein kinase 9 [Blattamonas nauphoetae]|uniref:CBL-interacting serine/threonine-protein kinase 9 n=1 Tax=Blattamonas nauphoetae TaxID=2049346 RepID=A0ABQ9WYG5_9EUKA|nr:putative CBL-interacting serine/threonine-protein kinase 9 [Blattamonas nauphoetae]